MSRRAARPCKDHTVPASPPDRHDDPSSWPRPVFGAPLTPEPSPASGRTRRATTVGVPAGVASRRAGGRGPRHTRDSDRSFMVSVLLALVLGVFGADRFYRGFPRLGVAKLLTCGGAGLWWLADLLDLLITGGRDAQGRSLSRSRNEKKAAWAISGGVLAMSLLVGAVGNASPRTDETPVVAGAETAAAAEAEVVASPTASPSTTAPAPAPDISTTAGLLATLEVKGRAPQTGYDRDLFSWRADTDHNGCDTRNDILRRDLVQITIKEGTHGCVVESGELNSPYSGQWSHFERSASTVDIDHVVSLSDGWQTGAFAWDEATRTQFANDPLNLLAVEATLNREKGDGDAATWLPPNTSYRCEYVSRQVAVKAKYGLWIKPAERDAILRVLEQCAGQAVFAAEVGWPAPGQGDVVVVAPVVVPSTTSAPAAEPSTRSTKSSRSGSESSRAAEPTAAPTQERAPETKQSTPEPAPAPQEDSSGGGGVSYKNCAEARAAGAAPLHRGDPGYAKKLDRDGDGVACE